MANSENFVVNLILFVGVLFILVILGIGGWYFFDISGKIHSSETNSEIIQSIVQPNNAGGFSVRSDFWDDYDIPQELLISLFQNDLNLWNESNVSEFTYNKTRIDLILLNNLSNLNISNYTLISSLNSNVTYIFNTANNNYTAIYAYIDSLGNWSNDRTYYWNTSNSLSVDVNITTTGNISTDYGFFSSIGSAISRVAFGWFDFLHADTLNASTANATTIYKDGNVVNATSELDSIYLQDLDDVCDRGSTTDQNLTTTGWIQAGQTQVVKIGNDKDQNGLEFSGAGMIITIGNENTPMGWESTDGTTTIEMMSSTTGLNITNSGNTVSAMLVNDNNGAVFTGSSGGKCTVGAADIGISCESGSYIGTLGDADSGAGAYWDDGSNYCYGADGSTALICYGETQIQGDFFITGVAEGDVLFVSSSNFVVGDDEALYYDNTNSRFGIGRGQSLPPESKLHVGGNASFDGNIYSSSNMTINEIDASGQVSAGSGTAILGAGGATGMLYLDDDINIIRMADGTNAYNDGNVYIDSNGNVIANNTNAEFRGKFNWTSNDQWTNFNGYVLIFNESMLETVYYNLTQSNSVVGTIEGQLADTQHKDGNYDGVTLNITEEAGSPGLDIRMNFTGVEDFNQGIMRYRTSSLSGDYPIIQVYDYTEGVWEEYPYVSETEGFATIVQPVFDSTNHIKDNVVQMRIYKASNGNTNNHYYIDWIAISDGYGTPSGEEVDPYSWHRNSEGEYGNFTTSGNLNIGGNAGIGTASVANQALTIQGGTGEAVKIYQGGDSKGISFYGYDDQSTSNFQFHISSAGRGRLYASSKDLQLQTATAGKKVWVESAGDFRVDLGDNAGSYSSEIRDSDNVIVSEINSNGDGYFAGDISAAGYSIHSKPYNTDRLNKDNKQTALDWADDPRTYLTAIGTLDHTKMFGYVNRTYRDYVPIKTGRFEDINGDNITQEVIDYVPVNKTVNEVDLVQEIWLLKDQIYELKQKVNQHEICLKSLCIGIK